jgi:hypothetical protein
MAKVNANIDANPAAAAMLTIAGDVRQHRIERPCREARRERR